MTSTIIFFPAFINFKERVATAKETSGGVILTLLNTGTGPGTVCEYLINYKLIWLRKLEFSLLFGLKSVQVNIAINVI